MVTFHSVATPAPRHAAAVGRAGLDLVVPYASGAGLVDGFLARERSNGRVVPREHWTEHNAGSYAPFSAPHHAAHRVTTCRDGRFVGDAALVHAAATRLAARNPVGKTIAGDAAGAGAVHPPGRAVPRRR